MRLRPLPLLAGGAVAVLGLAGLPVGGLVGLLAVFAIGALYRDDAFAAGVTFAVPGLALSTVRAVAESPWYLVAVIFLGPVALVLSGVLARVGAEILQLGRRVDIPAAAAPGSIEYERAREAIERRRRGFALVIVFASIVITVNALNVLFGQAADRRARDAERRLVSATRSWNAGDVMAAFEGNGSLPDIGWHLSPRTASAVEADVYYAWAQRCVVVELDDHTSRIEHHGC